MVIDEVLVPQWAFLPIVTAVLVGAILLSRNYFKSLVQRCEVRPSWTIFLGVIFLSCTLITESADLGAIAFGVVLINSILVVYPLYARESALLRNIEEDESLYLSQIFLITILFTLGLWMMPSTTILPRLDETGGILLLYSLIGIITVTLATISTRIISPRTDGSEGVEDEIDESNNGDDLPEGVSAGSKGVAEEDSQDASGNKQ